MLSVFCSGENVLRGKEDMKGNLRRLLAIFLVLTLLNADICAVAEVMATLTLPSNLYIMVSEKVSACSFLKTSKFLLSLPDIVFIEYGDR
jgi:hypothetical protein